MTRKRKVVWVGWESDRAGVAGELLGVLPRFPADAISGTVVFRHDSGPAALDVQHEGALVLELGETGGPRHEGFVGSTAALHRLRRILAELAPAVAHGLDEASGALVALAGRMAGVPVLVGTCRGHAPDRPGWRRRAALRRLDRIVVPSEALRDEVSGHLGGRHPGIVVVPPGIEPGEVRGLRDPAFSEPRPRVGTIATLGRGCGIEELMEAARLLLPRVPDLEWLVAGTGPEGLVWLRATQREGLDRCVRLLGDREDVAGLLASLDAYVEPGAPDALPSGLLQALAAGVPSVAVRNPTLARAFGSGGGLLFSEAGGPALAAAVGRVLADDEGPLRDGLRHAGPAAARGFSSEAHAQGLLGLYESLIAERPAR